MILLIAIIGAGGHAKCVYECFYLEGLDVYGFFDDDSSKTGLELIDGRKVIGVSRDITKHEEVDSLFLAIGDNRKRLAKYREYKEKNYLFPNAIHPRACLSKFSTVGEGNFMMGPAVLNPSSSIGNCCIINTGSTVGHDCILEDGVQIGPGVNIAGGSVLREGVFIGLGAKIGPGVTIGAWSVIGAGSVVLDDLPSDGFYHGIPVKPYKS